MRCPLCHQTIRPKAAWKSDGGQFYCSEFCADSETVAARPHHIVRKHEIDRQYRERLERLLPLRRALQASVGSPVRAVVN